MRPLPDKARLRIFWQVAVTSALEGQGESYEIFAGMLYRYVTESDCIMLEIDEYFTFEEGE